MKTSTNYVWKLINKTSGKMYAKNFKTRQEARDFVLDTGYTNYKPTKVFKGKTKAKKAQTVTTPASSGSVQKLRKYSALRTYPIFKSKRT